MRKTRWLVLLVIFAMIVAACGGDDEEAEGDEGAATTAAEGEDGRADMTGADFSIFGAPTGAEGEAMQGFLDVYNEQYGSNLSYEGSDSFEEQLPIRVEGGNPPDVSFIPQPARVCELADDGELVSLETMGFDIAELEETRSKFWMDLTLCSDGQHYGIPWFPNFKSIVFYHEPTFEAQGYEIPETYEDLVALSEQIVSDGMTPWCFGFGQDAGPPGWPGTDWLEDILVRNSGADVYAQWFKHEIPFNSPEVIEAFDIFGEILFGEGFVLGGAENVAAVSFQQSPLPLFNDPPSCLMLKQGSFINNFFPEGGEDIVKFFPFPTINGNTGALGGGDILMVFNDTPQVRQALTDWITPEWGCVLASPGGGTVSELGGHGVAGVERLPGHKDISADCYETEASQIIATAITEALAANTSVFDASDLMPSEVGAGSFWEGMVDFAEGTPAQEVADEIEASWPE